MSLLNPAVSSGHGLALADASGPAETAPAPTPTTTSAATDPRAAFLEARGHAERTLLGELQRMEDAFVVALKQAEERIATLQAQHDALAKAHADAEAKLAVLKEVRARLDALAQ